MQPGEPKNVDYKAREEITYPLPNSNGATAEVWERISIIPHRAGYVIIYPCCD